MRKTCRKCGLRLGNFMADIYGECRIDFTACYLRSALRTERRKVRVLREVVSTIAGYACEDFDCGTKTCADFPDHTPCASCYARRGLEQAKERRR